MDKKILNSKVYWNETKKRDFINSLKLDIVQLQVKINSALLVYDAKEKKYMVDQLNIVLDELIKITKAKQSEYDDFDCNPWQ